MGKSQIESFCQI